MVLWSGQRAFPCSIINFSFVLCIAFLYRLWFLRFKCRKRLFCWWWLILGILSLWYLEFCLWTIEANKLLVSFLILSQISINESFGTSFKAWKHSFLTILRSSMLLVTAAIMLSRKIKEALRRIFRHDFCRSSDFEHNKILNLKDKPFGYFWLLMYFSKKKCPCKQHSLKEIYLKSKTRLQDIATTEFYSKNTKVIRNILKVYFSSLIFCYVQIQKIYRSHADIFHAMLPSFAW